MVANRERLIRFKEVLEISGIRSRTTLRQHEEIGAFPRRVPVGVRSVAWLESEVQAWVAARTADRDEAAIADAAKERRDPNQWIDTVLQGRKGADA